MIRLEKIKTIYDLLHNSAMEYKNKTFISYEENRTKYEKGYEDFYLDCHYISAWIDELNKKEGRKIQAALLGKNGYLYLTALIGTINAGSIAAPIDVRLNEEDILNSLIRRNIDIIFYDYEFDSKIKVIKEKCRNIKRYICLQERDDSECIEDILREYSNKIFVSTVKPDDNAVMMITSDTKNQSKEVMLSHANLLNNVFSKIEDYKSENEIYLNMVPVL